MEIRSCFLDCAGNQVTCVEELSLETTIGL